MNPSSSIAASTRARVSGRTRSGWFSTFETVPTATPARLATSFMPAAISPLDLASQVNTPSASNRRRLVLITIQWRAAAQSLTCLPSETTLRN